MTRHLTRGELAAGIAGLALLRAHHNDDTRDAEAIKDELASTLAHINEPPLGQDLLGEPLDPGAGYARWASVYDQPGNWVIDCEEPVVWALLDRLEGEPVLDAACGTGRHLDQLAALGRKVIGVDLTTAMLEKARARVPVAQLKEGDLLALPVEDGAVAGVVSALALEHVSDLPQAYAELARVVRPGGWVVISTVHPTTRGMLGMEAYFVDAIGPGHVITHPQTLSDHLNAAAAAGLVLQSCHEPVIDTDTALRLAPSAPVGGAIGLRGVPIVLVCEFRKVEPSP